MKRSWSVLLFTLLVVAVAAFVSAGDKSELTIRPSEMKEGESKTLIGDGKTITVRRDGDTLNLKIEGAKGTRNLTITSSDDGTVHIDRNRSVYGPRIIVKEGQAMTLDSKPFPSRRKLLRDKAQSWFVCPKDHSLLRVPDAKEGDTFKCPVDGTTMEKKHGRAFSFFLDDGELEHLKL